MILKALCAGVFSFFALMPISAFALGYPPANAGLRERVLQEFPDATHIFVNCPGNNGNSLGLNCETRFLIGDRVRVAYGFVEPDGPVWPEATWASAGLLVDSPPGFLRHSHCEAAGLQKHDHSASDFKLRAYGVPCETAHYISGAMLTYLVEHISTDGLRLPTRFSYDSTEGQTLGFIVKRFGCSSRTTVYPGNPNPYGHEVAHCRSRFGDRFVFAFDQSS